MLYTTTSDNRFVFDFTYPTPDDEAVQPALSPGARGPRPGRVAAGGYVQLRWSNPV